MKVLAGENTSNILRENPKSSTIGMKMAWDGIFDPDVDEYNEIMRIQSKELLFEYVCKKKT